MSDVDPTKLKVVELRAELASRNLDTKGNKAVLVKRLKNALNKESGNIDAGGDDADVSMDADDSQIMEDDSQIKDDSEENACEMNNDTGEEEPTKEDKIEDDAEVKEDENEEGSQEEAKDEEEDDDQDKSEDADLIDGDDVGPTEDQVIIDSVTDEEPNEKRPEKRKRSRSPTDKTRSRSRSPHRHHDRQRRSEDRRHRSRSRNRDYSRHGHDRSHHRSRSKSPTKIETEPEEPFDDTLVSLDKYNSDLYLQVDKTRYSAEPLTAGAFAFMWAGVRSSYGVKKGKICFETKLVKNLDVTHLPSEEVNHNLLRVGLSVETASLQLGEEPLSYAYDATSKMVTNCEFKEYGSEFGEGDVITSFLNMDVDPVQISFAKNGKHEGVAFEVAKEDLEEKALFPHVLTKNCSFEVNFGQKEEPSFPLPEGYEDFVYINAVPLEERERGTKAPEKREDCEIIMMCGLPGCGKTTWALNYASEHPEKKYYIIGTSSIIDKMKVMGEPRKKTYTGKWDSLIEKATRCLNKLLDMGARTLRNFILDQTNVFASAQRRKMRPFEGFKRKAVVIVPTDEEFKRRCEKQEKEDGKDVSDHAVNEMKANFSLPQTETVFDDIVFVELNREESEPLIRKYSEEGRKALPPPHKRFRPNDRSRGPPPRGPPGRRGGSGGYRGPPSGGRGGAIPLRVSDNRNSRNKKGMYGGPRPRGPPGGQGRRMRGPPGGGNRNRSRGYQGGGYNYGQGNWNQGGGGNWKSGGYYGQQGGYGGGGGGSYGGYQQQHWSQPYYQQHQGYGQYYNQGGYGGGGGGYHQGYGYGQK